MGKGQFIDLYAEINKGYIRHKQNHYKHYSSTNQVYTEELFWEKLVHLGWRKSTTDLKIAESLGVKPAECLVLVCPDCELAITKVVLKNSPTIDSFLNVDKHITIHNKNCKATGKADQE